MRIFTKMTLYFLAISALLLLSGGAMYGFSLELTNETGEILDGIGTLLCEIAFITGCAGIMTGVLSIDECKE